MRIYRASFIVVGLALLGYGVVGFLTTVVWPPQMPRGVARTPSQARVRLRQIAMVVHMYEEEQRDLPFHPLGPRHALYLLKPYITKLGGSGASHDATLFDCPGFPPGRAGMARWDDASQRLWGGDYDYLNPKPPRLGGRLLDPLVIIVAEKSGLRRTGKWGMTRDYRVGWYNAPRGGREFAVLGRKSTQFRRLMDLKGAESGK